MTDHESELLKKAEDLENEAKIAIKNKDYNHAISRFMVAKEIYAKLGLTGQVGIIIRDVVRLKNLLGDQKISQPSQDYGKDLQSKTKVAKEIPINEEQGNNLLEKARNLALNNNLDEALKTYEEAYNIFDSLHFDYECRQILLQINEVKEYKRREISLRPRGIKVNIKDIVSLAAAERRRLKIQEQLTNPRKPFIKRTSMEENQTEKEVSVPKIFAQKKLSEVKEAEKERELQSIKESQQEIIRIQQKEKEERLRRLKEQQKQEDTIIAEAERLLDQGNLMLKQKNYNQAKDYYQQSIELFIKLGWNNQVSLLQNELKNIDRYKREQELRYQQTTFSKLKSEQEFQQKVSSVLDEKQRIEEKEKIEKKVIPPEIRIKLEKIELIKVKINKEEQAGNYPRVISRYEYILNELKSIPSDIIGLSQEIANIEAKITELKSKM